MFEGKKITKATFKSFIKKYQDKLMIKVSSKFDVVSGEIASLVAGVESISQSIESVAAEIHRQNDSVKSVNDEIGKMKLVTNSLDSSVDA